MVYNISRHTLESDIVCSESRNLSRKYNYIKRVAGGCKSSLPATCFHFAKMNIAMKKCVACQRKSSLYDRVRTFFVQKREELRQNGGKQQNEGYAGE